MTEIRITSPAQRVVVYGDYWPVVSAVNSMVKYMLPDCVCRQVADPLTLMEQLDQDPQTVMLLCLRPRDHVFLFHALKDVLVYHPALIISDELFFCDRVLLDSWGPLPWMTQASLKSMITGRMLCEHTAPWQTRCPEKSVLTDFLMKPMLPAGRPELPYSFYVEERLMDYMSLLMYRALTEKGLTPFRLRLLQAIWSGHHSLRELSGIMDVSPQKIWQEKNRLLMQLDMRPRLRELVYGTRFCVSTQRTPFMPVEKIQTAATMFTDISDKRQQGTIRPFGRGSYSACAGK